MGAQVQLFFFWLYIGIGVLMLLVLIFVIAAALNPRLLQPIMSKQAPTNAGRFSDALGNEVVAMMRALTATTDEVEAADLARRIQSLCVKRLESPKLSYEARHILDTVHRWIQLFNTSQHVLDIRTTGTSPQITFNPQTQDFSLRAKQVT